MFSGFDFVLAGFVSAAAGLINALAGGGTLITFPMLVALGVPAVEANVTNTVALCPGYLGGIYAQSQDMRGQKKRLLIFMPAAIAGGIIGGFLLLNTGERVFRALIPFLILLASVLLAVQEPVRKWLVRRSSGPLTEKHASEKWAALPVGIAAVYGGYFGAGLSVIILSVLGLCADDSLTRLNAIKQAISFVVNSAAALFFIFSGRVLWPFAIVMAIGAVLGGILGGKLAGRIKPATLRWTVVTIGITVAAVYFFRDGPR
jgi:uncharacterized protein